LTLTDRITRPIHPTSDYGPFRIGLVDLEYQRHVGFAVVAPQVPRIRGRPNGGMKTEFVPPQPRPTTSVQCSVQFQVSAEPRLSISQSGPLQILEARDDRGNSLTAAARGTSVFERNTTYLGGTCSSVLHLRALLQRPEKPGESIKSLRGVIPLRVTARRPDPLIVSLASAVGKTFHKGDLHLTVHEVRSDPNVRQRQIDLSVRVGRLETTPTVDDLSVPDPNSRPDPHRQNIEVIDAQDHVLSWFQTTMDVESSRITLTMTNSPGAAEPKELRYYTLTESTLTVPFSFSDLPMP
jgi:hypothetical protein